MDSPTRGHPFDPGGKFTFEQPFFGFRKIKNTKMSEIGRISNGSIYGFMITTASIARCITETCTKDSLIFKF